MKRNYTEFQQVFEKLLRDNPHLAENKTAFARRAINESGASRTEEAMRKLVREFLNEIGYRPDADDKLTDMELPIDSVENTYKADIPARREKLHIILGCLHFPFHNKRMWDSTLKFIHLNRDYIGSVTLAGDIHDMHSISRHNKGKITIPGLTLSIEYQMANKCLDDLDQAIGNAPIRKHFMWGNHEMWYYAYMAEVDHSKLGDEVILSPTRACHYKERGYEIQTDYRTAYVMIGDTEVIHGDYACVNAAKKHLDVMKRNTIFFHTHRMGSYAEEKIAAYNAGWGGQKEEKAFGYMTRVQKETWRNGFGIVMVDAENYTHYNQVEFINNKFAFDGRFY